MALAREQKLLIAGGGDNCVRLLPPLLLTRRKPARRWRSSRPPARPRRRAQAEGGRAPDVDSPPAISWTSGGWTPPTCAPSSTTPRRRKAARAGWPKGRIDADAPAADRTLAMIFQKNSTRTRFSFDAAMRQLGGARSSPPPSDMQLGRGETIEDTARVLSRMVDVVMIRANRHEDVEAFAAAASVPVINGLTDSSHPCQIMADIMTFEEHRGSIGGRDAGLGRRRQQRLRQLHPRRRAVRLQPRPSPARRRYQPNAADLARAGKAGASVQVTHDPREAARGADAVITDTWVSMGDTDAEARLEGAGALSGGRAP